MHVYAHTNTDIRKHAHDTRTLPPHTQVVGDIEEAPRDGAYVTGLWIEGASMANAYLQKARRGSNMEKLPILHIRAIRKTSRRGGIHNVPLYLTRNRGAGFVGEIQIKTKAPSAKWTLAGLAAILDPTN